MSITDTESIKFVQDKAEALMEEINIEYTEIAEKNYNALGLFKKLTSHFGFPPSLRFYHVGEKHATGQSQKRLKELRKVFHEAWGLLHIMQRFKNGSKAIVKLDEYESETFISVAEHIGFKYNSYMIKNEKAVELSNIVNT